MKDVMMRCGVGVMGCWGVGIGVVGYWGDERVYINDTRYLK
jgi:hypothetical protein